MVITAAVVLGVIVAIGVQWAADRLAAGLSDKLDAIYEGLNEISEAVAEPTPTYVPRPTRTITAERGTRLAYVFETKDRLFEIAYAPVLAFVETYNENSWDPLALIEGSAQVRDCSVERVLLPGQSLTEQECIEMKQRYADENPVEVPLAAQERGGSV